MKVNSRISNNPYANPDTVKTPWAANRPHLPLVISYTMIFLKQHFIKVIARRKNQESIRSNTTPDKLYQMGKWQQHKKASHTRDAAD